LNTEPHLDGDSRREGAGRPLGAGTPSDGEGISLKLDSGPEAAAAARAALRTLEPRLAPDPMNDVRLLVSELVTNSVRHSEGANSGAPVTLEVALSDEKLRVMVTDRGTGFEPHPREPGQSKASGWGLYLVDKLADRWGVIRNHITRVWFEIDTAGKSRTSTRL
jgi:anti-sigma regulatory factor (Ser/Thr protein kinase)